MVDPGATVAQLQCVGTDQLQTLIDLLYAQGYQVIGPTVRDNAIVYDEVTRLSELPVGWTDRQEAGTYGLDQRADGSLFAYNLGPTSWKKFLHPERLRLWRAQRDGTGVRLLDDPEVIPRFAFLGVRSCELHAIAIQDKVFVSSAYQDENYALRRANTLLIAVNCGQAASTCFCASMQTGPGVSGQFDLALTELNEEHHRFVVRAGSNTGQALLDQLDAVPAVEADIRAAQSATDNACAQMGRQMDTTGIGDFLKNNLDHPRWSDVGDRCLSCANCTMVCPTCFCTTVQDSNDLTGDHAERWRHWHSCFTLDFSYVHGGSVRSSAKSRYRQWMTHKLANWFDQFDSSGCVGCGRCITWCPVGIDITAEVAAMRADQNTSGAPK